MISLSGDRGSSAIRRFAQQSRDSAKVGHGYSFGVSSDDLRDTTLDDKGVFLNPRAKFYAQQGTKKVGGTPDKCQGAVFVQSGSFTLASRDQSRCGR